MQTTLSRIAIIAAISTFAYAAHAQTGQPAAGQSQGSAKTAKADKNALRSNEYASESDAKSRCSSDTVVWSNFNTKVYHYAGNADYGKTKKGAYMCEKQAQAARFRAAKNEKKS